MFCPIVFFLLRQSVSVAEVLSLSIAILMKSTKVQTLGELRMRGTDN